MIAEIIIQKEADPRQSNWRGLPLFLKNNPSMKSCFQFGEDSKGCAIDDVGGLAISEFDLLSSTFRK